MGEVCQGCEGPLAGSIGSFASGSRCLVVRRGVLGGLCWRSGGCRRGWRRRGWWPCVARRPVSEGGFLDCRPVPLARWSWIWWGGCASRATPVARRRRSNAPRRGSVRGWPRHGWASSATPTPPRGQPRRRSTINQVERFFAYVTSDLLQRSDHRSVQALEGDIRNWVKAWNDDPRPFIWTKSAEQILDPCRSARCEVDAHR